MSLEKMYLHFERFSKVLKKPRILLNLGYPDNIFYLK